MSVENLSDLYQRAAVLEHNAQWTEAEVLYRDLFRQELLAGNDVSRAVDALRHQAIACWHQGRSEEVEELAILSWMVAERCGYTKGAARAVNILALVRYSQTDFAEAKTLYEVARSLGTDAGDDEVIGFSCQNLGIIADITGDLREARTLYLEAIASAVRTGAAPTAARVYNNLGITCTRLHDWMEAELYFTRGIEISEETGDFPLLALLHTNRARPLIQVREFARTRSSLAAAEAIAASLGDAGTLAEVEVYRGTIARLQSDLAAAEAHLQRALSLSAGEGMERERALAMEEVAQVRWMQGRMAEAIEQLGQAGELFRMVGSQRDLVRVEEQLVEWGASAESLAAAG